MNDLAKNIDDSSISKKEEELSFETNQSAYNFATHFLRSIKGRNDLANAVQSGTNSSQFSTQIEKIRINLKLKKLDNVLQSFNTIIPSTDNERIEFLLEKSKYYLIKKDYINCINEAKSILNEKTLAPISKVTTLQVMSLAKMRLGFFESSIEMLEEAKVLSELLPQIQSGYQLSACLVHSFSELKKEQKARIELDSLFKKVNLIEDKDTWLSRYMTYKRARAGYLKHFESIELQSQNLLECQHIAKWLGEFVVESQCLRERSEINTQTEKVHEFSNWIFLPDDGLILFKDKQTYNNIKNLDLMSRILKCLAMGDISQENFFKEVWGLEISRDEHLVHVRANLSKLRKILPKKSVVVKNNIISLI